MKPGIPWSVKGIEPDAREAAKDAARRRGMTLGAWLNTMIMEQSEPGEARPAARDSFKSAAGDPDTQLRLDELAAQLAELSRQDHQSMAGRHPEHVQPPKDVSRILERIDATERETVEALSALNDRLADLGKEFAHSVNLASFMKPEDVPGYPALEGALRNVIDHIATSEARAQESLKSMQERLSDIANRASSSTSETVEKSRSYVRLEERLAELATRIARTETAARQELPPLMSEELAKLSDRIESVRLNSDAQLQRAISAATQAVQKELREIREVEVRMKVSLAEALAEMQASARAGFEDPKARAEIEGLSQRFDDLKADAASERDIHSLRVAVEQISARVAQGADFRPLAEMEKRLGDISDRLERASTETLTVTPQIAELEQRISSLDQKLMKLLAESGEINAWPAI
jgi:localization factor PodJL